MTDVLASSPSIRVRVALYFIAAFLVSWGAIAFLTIPAGYPASAETKAALFGFVFLSMAFVPPTAGLVFTWIYRGAEGLRALWERQTHVGVSPAYWIIALLLVPATALGVLLFLSVMRPEFVPGVATAADPVTLLAIGVGGGLFAGVLEEIGWTGFAARSMLSLNSVLRTGLIIGVLHGVWHLAAGFWGEGESFGWMFVPYFAVVWIVGLTALRILIVWLYRRTRSLPIAQLTHASYTGGLLIVGPAGLSPSDTFLWMGLFAVALAVVVAVICFYFRQEVVGLSAPVA